MNIKWNFLKVILQQDLPFERRKEVLEERFKNADTYTRSFRGTEYRYQLYDVEAVHVDTLGRRIVLGHLTRSPKVAHGRSLNENTRKSEEGAVNVPEIADYTEFIYDLDSCVLAMHQRTPFTASGTIVKAWQNLLGQTIAAPGRGSSLDVHVEVMRDPAFVANELDTAESLWEAKLVYAKPNPNGGDESLARITLGLIGEETGADEINFDAKRRGTGSLRKDENSFLRRSITTLLANGYLKRGLLRIGHRVVDILEAKEKVRDTSGYRKDENGVPLGLKAWTAQWLRELLENADIYLQRTDNDDE